MHGKIAQITSLEDTVRAIHAKFAEALSHDKKACNARIMAGQMLLALRKRIEEDEEAGPGVEWWPWYATHFVRSRKDAEKVMRMASAEDPEAAAEEEKAATRARKPRGSRAGGAGARSTDRTEDEQEPEDEEEEPEDDVDIVAKVFRQIVEMNDEQRRSLFATIKRYFKW